MTRGKSPTRAAPRGRGQHGAVKARPAGTLKQAILLLVEAVGGHVRAAEICECSKGHVQRWTDPDGDCASVLPPVHKIRALEAVAGDPIVTRFLAAEAGHALVSVQSDPEVALGVLLALAAGEGAEVLKVGADALRDGVLTAKEAGRLVPEIDDAMRAFAALRVLACAKRDGGA